MSIPISKEAREACHAEMKDSADAIPGVGRKQDFGYYVQLAMNAAVAKLRLPSYAEGDNTGFHYLVSYSGGIGPDVWDSEMTVYATDIADAIGQAQGRVDEAGGWISQVTQDDGPVTKRQELEDKLEAIRGVVLQYPLPYQPDTALMVRTVIELLEGNIGEMSDKLSALKNELESVKAESLGFDPASGPVTGQTVNTSRLMRNGDRRAVLLFVETIIQDEHVLSYLLGSMLREASLAEFRARDMTRESAETLNRQRASFATLTTDLK